MKKIVTFVLFSVINFSIFSQNSESKILQFKYHQNDNYQFNSVVEEEVKMNGRLLNHATIVNRSTISVSKVDENGRGYEKANFMTSEIFNGYPTWSENFESEYWRSRDGKFEIADSYIMPVVRDVPIFSEKPVKIGDTWTADGYEAEDMRKLFGIPNPVKVPFTASYTYLRDEERISSDSKHEKRNLQVIQVNYSINYENPQAANSYTETLDSIMGFSNKTIWWDNEKGQIDHFDENFRIIITSLRGNVLMFTGTSKSEVTEFKRTASEAVVQQVQSKVDQLGIKDVSVKKSENGLTLSLEKIQFEPNSSNLLESEQAKLDKIAEILSGFPNDLLIEGHTARSGSEESCQILSEERANSVADYLVGKGTRKKNQIFTTGKGSRIPIMSNDTPEGMARNRRVEITILDK